MTDNREKIPLVFGFKTRCNADSFPGNRKDKQNTPYDKHSGADRHKGLNYKEEDESNQKGTMKGVERSVQNDRRRKTGW